MQILGENLKDETCLEIGKFAILWNCFESKYCQNNANPTTIKESCDRITIDHAKLNQFAKTLKNRINFLGESIDAYVENGLHPEGSRRSTPTDMSLMKVFLEQHDGSLEQGCLLIIYRIRNNLMHGLKCIEELEIQFELFSNANLILEAIC